MKQLYPTNFTFTFRLLSLYRNTGLFILIFLLNFTFGFGQNSVIINSAEENFTNDNPVPVEIIFEKGIDEIDPNDFQYINGDLINFKRQDPEYWQSKEDLLIEKFNFNVSLGEILNNLNNVGGVLVDKLSNTVIAISQLNISELLFLKYNDGVDILNLNSGNRKETDIVAEDLSSPLDVEAYFNEMVYVADNEAQDIKVYDNVPQFVTAITPIDDDASDDLGPTSLVTDKDGNLYITVAHNGTNEYDNVDRVYIYDNNRNLTYEIEDGNNYELNSPYKIAVDNAGKLYVVDAGSSDSSNGRILIFEFNGTTYDLIDTIEGAEDDLNSPGSIVVDDYGYIYVVDYLEQIVFNKIFEEPLSFISNYNEIKNSNFPVKVFDPNFKYVTEISGLNLPVDLELDHCGNLLVNNLEIQGDDIDEEDMIGPYPTSVNNDFEFTLKTFTRRDTFTADFEIDQQCEVASFTIPVGLENKSNCSINPEAEETFSIILDENAPVVTTCYQENQTVEMGDEIPNYVEEDLVVFEDNCEGTLEYDQTPTPGTEISQQTTTVTITATDEAGNVSDECTFDLVVEEEEPDNPPQFTNCPQNIIEIANDPGECGAILDFETPEATDDQGNPTVTQISGPVNGDFLSVEDGVVDLVFQADDGVNAPVNCTVQIRVVDAEKPVISDCPPENIEFTIQEGETYPLPNYTNQVTVEDNCETGLEAVQDPPAGTPIDDDQVVTLTATDEAGNEDVCIFTVKITSEAAPDPTFDCPLASKLDPIFYGESCSVSFPDYEISNPQNFESDPFLVQTFTENENSVSVNIEVYDGENGDLVDECSFDVDLVDNQDPIISNCPPENIEFTIQEGETYPLPNYTNQVTVEDNCETGLEAVQDPAPGTLIDEDQVVTLTTTDEAGNETECIFTVRIQEISANRIPNALAESYTINQGEVLDIDVPGVLENDSDPDGDNLTAELRRPAAEGDFSFASNGSFTYEPDPGFVGEDDFIYVAYDGEAFSGEVRVTITVNQENSAPIANPDAYSTEVDTPLNISAAEGVLANDSDPDGDALIAIPNQDVTGGTLTLNEDGSFSYVPETGFTGSDTFTYFAFDGEIQVETTVSIVVAPNDSGAPVANDDFYSLNENEELQISAPGILRNDSDPEDRELIPSETANTSNGTLVLSSDGAFVYTPNPGFSGTDSFSYLVNNGEQNSNVATVTLSVEPLPNDAPIALPDSYSVLENGELIVNAPGVMENDYDPDGDPFTAILLDLPSQGTIDFNPDGSFTYIPNSGYTGPDSFTYMLNDEKNFSNEVTVTITVNARNPAPQFEDCPTLIQRNVSTGECEALVMFDVPTASDDSGELTVNLISELGSGDLFPVGTTTVTYQATGENGETITCSFEVMVVDNIPPSISCPGDQTENFDPETGFEVPNYESWATFSDNCGEVSFRQEPEAGAIIFQDTTVQLFAEDANEQVASCSFELQLTEANVLNIFCQIDQNVSPDEDCSFTLPDYTDTAEVSLPGATVAQSPPEGTVINENTQVKLTATLNGETDECFFMVNLVDNENPVANCVSGYVVNLDESGNATLAPEMLDNNSTDNCGIVSMALSQINFTRADIGEVPITLTVRDDAGNMDTCETTVEVVDENSGEFECRENVVVNLNENGEAVLSLQELYTGNASGLTLAASRLNFMCSDLGMVQIQLDYSGAQTGSCTINVEVRDEIPPFINTDIVELTLDDEGFAYLEEGDVLAENNCGQQFIYRFSKSVFNCENVGLNTVNVEVEDANGNIAEKNIEVRVNGEACEIPDNEDLEFLFIYPNPNNGIFTIATPEGMLVEQVRVFDSRGRFILQKEYKDIARFYRMTIEGVESSVYTLQIFTNEGVVVKRVIISQ